MTEAHIALETCSDVSHVADEWDELADDLRAGPFARPGWVAAWQSAFGVGLPEILVARRADRLVGVLPLVQRRGKLLSPANAHTPEAGPLATDHDVARALLGRAFRERARAVSIGPMDASAPALVMALEAAKSAGYRSVVRPVARSPFIRGRHLGGFRAGASRNLGHDVERRLRRLCEAGAVCIELRDGRDGLADALEEGLAVESSGWKGASGTAIASQLATTRFYEGVAAWAASRGWLRLALLRLDGRAIAFQLDLEALGAYYSLKIGYDPAYERFSPGKLLMYEMVSRAMALRLTSYELLGTDEPWKSRWADGFRDRSTLHAFSSSPAGRLTRAAFVSRGTLARRVPLVARAAASRRKA